MKLHYQKYTPVVRRFWLIPVTLVVGFGSGWLGAFSYDRADQADGSSSRGAKYISSESELIAQIAKQVGPSVVSVDVERRVTTQDFFGFNQTLEQQSAGTGFIISDSGFIVTNRHVVPSGTQSVSVTLADGTRYDEVRVVGRTSSGSPLDVAFLKITDTKGKKLTPAVLGDSSKVRVGERVIAIGNALGQFQNTVTSGIISGFGRDVTAGSRAGEAESLSDLFQTDAAINEGNSGGPLVNGAGEVIGITTAVASEAQNIGFAIPINDVKGLVASVLSQGELLQPYLGVRYVSLTDDLAATYDLPVNRGAYIVPSDSSEPSVLPGSPAAEGGLRERDIITKLNGIPIDDKTNLTNALFKLKVGDVIRLTVIRGQDTLVLQVKLTAAPSS
ncbi:MAG: trypsin-like peptidase domain-containing protein [Candidatus Saccharimonadales bacterium]